MQDYREMKVWEKAHRFALDIYKVTQKFPKDERYGIISQLRRAAASVPTNIAEGCGRGTTGELAQFKDRRRFGQRGRLSPLSMP